MPSTGWSRAAETVWAKTKPQTGEWMPLFRHLEDSAAVAGLIWDEWLPEVVKTRIAEGVPGGDPGRGRRLLTWLAGVHDIGKASPAFAIKAARLPGFGGVLDDMARCGLVCPPGTGLGASRPPTHGLVGHLLVRERLEEAHRLKRRVSTSLAVVVGGHHGVPPTSVQLRQVAGDVMWTGAEKDAWRDVQGELLDGMEQRTDVAGVLAQLHTPIGVDAQVLLTAAVIVADWLASDAERFPLSGLEPSCERACSAWTDLDLPPVWRAGDPPANVGMHLRGRFPALGGCEARPVQVAAVEAARSAESAPLMIIEAPMGEGKTEAALAAAEVLASRFGCGGVFVGLPTMATADAMFGRALSWAKRLPGADLSVFLAHGKAGLNDTYRGLVRDSRHIQSVFDDDTAGRATTTRVATWLTGRKKGVLANLVVGTIDQALFSALKTRHLALRHLGLAGKVVVVDEVHAADDYMRVYLCRALEWLAAYSTPVILLSATLPPDQRNAFLASFGSEGGVPAPDADAYPRVTVYDGAVREVVTEAAQGDKALHLERLHDETSVVVETVRDAVDTGACVAVVRDTVERAQAAYDALLPVVGEQRIMLLHSRFLASHRAAREADLRHKLGPPTDQSAERPAGYVVIGTQVLEQSLDIDVDLMISDIAPIDLVLQRSGRLHRHSRTRPSGFGEVRLLVTGVDDWSTSPPTIGRGPAAVYGQAKLLRALAVLEPHLNGGGSVMVHDIPRLVREAYDRELRPPAGWEDDWAAAEREAATHRAEQQSAAESFLLQHPDESGSLVDWLDVDVEEENPKGRAQVRDSEDGIEVIVVQRTDAGLQTLPDLETDAVHVIPVDFTPEGPLARRLLACSVRLPQWMCRGDLGDQVIADLESQAGILASWQGSSWLAGELVVILDRDLSVAVAGWRLRYDMHRGLDVERGGTTS